MNRIIIKKCILLIFVLLFTFSACTNSNLTHDETSNTGALNDYEQLIPTEHLGEMQLTICYMDPWILTNVPLSAEKLMTTSTLTKKIVVEPEELIKHTELIGGLNTSMLNPVGEKTYINARICYVFETEDGRKIFDFASNGYGYSSVFVNGEEVEHRHIFYEIITPFLSEEDREILGFPKT